MKIKYITAKTLVAIAMLTTAWACSNDDTLSDNDNQTQNSGLVAYHLSLNVEAKTENGNTNSGSTRALSLDEQNKIRSTWHKDDPAYLYVSADKTVKRNTYCFGLAQATSKRCTFDGTIYSTNLKVGQKISFLYPGATTADDCTIRAAVADKETVTDSKLNTFTIKFFKPNDNITNTAIIDMSKQDGTLETIGKHYDFQWLNTSITNVNTTGKATGSVETEGGTAKRLVGFWALSFKDENNNPIDNVDLIQIRGIQSSDVLDLSTGEMVGNDNDKKDVIDVVPAEGTTFNFSNNKPIYIAMLPGVYNISFIVKAGKKLYKKTYNQKDIILEANTVYTSTLKMQPIKHEPYVEVEGVKWATGNFITYTDPNQASDNFPNGTYWGIAPTQWWISDYYFTSGDDAGKGSQDIDDYRRYENNLDLFRPGDIVNATIVATGDAFDKYEGSGRDFQKKIYARAAGKELKTEEEIDNAKTPMGDLPWYYTRKRNNKYKMPQRKDFQKLFDNANVYAAYCVTDKGNKVYGVYFTTHNPKTRRFRNVPIGRRMLQSKVIDVTFAVKANLGLFLPIAGRSFSYMGPRVGYREMWNNLYPAYGQYQSSTSTVGASECDQFFIGINEWNLAASISKVEACSIRPIYDDSSVEGEEDPVYPPFKTLWYNEY